MTDLHPASLSPASLAYYATSGKWQMARHLSLINRVILDAAAGFLDRVIISMPPRHGKSTIISKFLPAWWMGSFPDHQIMLASYGADLASKWGAESRAVIEEFGPSLFDVSVSDKSRAGKRWKLFRRSGTMETFGVRGPATGKGANLLLLDDVVKDSVEAESPTYRERNWDWYQSTAYTRLEPGGVVIAIGTRWHEDDLLGRLLNPELCSDKFYNLSLPAFALRAEPPFPAGMGRAVGDPLWPERWPAAALERIKENSSARWWSALYDQEPRPLDSGMFREDWFKLTASVPQVIEESARFWDLAASDESSASADYTAGVRVSRSGRNYYVMDVRRVRQSPKRIHDFIRHTAIQDGRHVKIYVEQEPGASSIHLESYFRSELLREFRVEFVPSRDAKETRAAVASAQAEHGRVFIRCHKTSESGEPVPPDWYRDFVTEAIYFPYGNHDDQVDAFTGALTAVALPEHLNPLAGAANPLITGAHHHVQRYAVAQPTRFAF